jgi:hypothetical protein
MLRTRFIVLLLLVLPSAAPAQSTKIWFQASKTHVFSNPSTPDTFVVTAAGMTIYDSFVTIRIITATGLEIFRNRCSMNEFRERGPEDGRTVEDSLSLLFSLDYILSDANFHTPALSDTIDMQSNFISRDVWEEFYGLKDAVGFYFQIGAEDIRGIAYSKRRKCVIQYFACC